MGVETSEQRVKAACPSAKITRNVGHTKLKSFIVAFNGYPHMKDPTGFLSNWQDTAKEAWDEALEDKRVVAFESTLRVQDAPEVVRDDAEGKPKCNCWIRENQVCDICQGVSPLVVTRDGVPCADQKAALAEFVEHCTAKPLSPDPEFQTWAIEQKFKSPSAIHFARQGWDAHAALSLARPEGESKVMWRVDVCTTSGKWGKLYSADLQATAENLIVDALQGWPTARLVKIETYETVIETRTKEPSRG